METGEGEPKEKDIVWAKIKGYPWWPGTIRAISSHKNQTNNKKFSKKKVYTVDFIGNKSHGEVSKNDINLFRQNYEEHCKTKNPSLIKSIELAKKLYQEKTKNKILDTSTHEKVEDSETKGKNTDYNLLGKKRKDTIKINNCDNNGEVYSSNGNFIGNGNKKEDIMRNNDIKINININVTNNNQRTVNINSFSSNNNSEKNKKRKRKKKHENFNKNKKNVDEEYVFEEEEEEESEDNYNEDNEEYDFDEESIENELLDIKQQNYQSCYTKINNNKLNHNNDGDNNYIKKGRRKKKKLIRGSNTNTNNGSNTKEDKDKKSYKSNEINEDMGLDMDLDMSKDMKNCEDLDKIIHNLVNYQIQTSNNQNQKLIIKELNQLQNIMNNSKINSINLYYNYNQLYKLLSTFTYNKNSDIVFKSAEILSNLPNAIINDIFVLSKEEEQNLLFNKAFNNTNNNEEEFINNELKTICDYISNNNNNITEDKDKDNISNRSKKMKSKKNINYNSIKDNVKDSTKDKIKDNNIKDESFLSFDSNNNSFNNNSSNKINISDNNNNFTDNIINIIIKDLSDNFYNISENFFKNIYNKNDIGLNKNLAMKRKFVCIKLFTLFKKVFPKLDKEYIKKIIIFFEHKIRSEDPTLGPQYKKEIVELFYKVKNIKNKK